MITMFVNTGSIDALAKKLEDLRPGGALYDVAVRTAATDMLADTTQRIHVDGKASDGSDIGQYSEKPIYVNPNNSPKKFPTTGKSRDYTGRDGERVQKPPTDTFKSGQRAGEKHATAYFYGGYKEFREAVGRPADKVILDLTGSLRMGLQVIPTPTGYGLGWQDDLHFKVASGMEAKYGKLIWFPTEEEQALASTTIDKIISDGLSQ